jgi:hypothetical protein
MVQKMDEVEFEFPDEKKGNENTKAQDDNFEFEIEDDTPPEDRGRSPLPKNLVEELDKDELEEYSENVKVKLKQLKKVWHDERRDKDQAMRERMAAEDLAKQMLEENRRLKARISEGERSFLDTYKGAAELELSAAEKAYKDAYDMGDSDALIAAQKKLNAAQMKLQKAQDYVPALQQEEDDVKVASENQVPRPDQRAVAWQERNTWFGKDEEMTSLALGLHQKLVNQYGASYPSTDEYWTKVDETMRRRFPDYFEGQRQDETQPTKQQRTEKPSTVVAPATRSTGSKKVVLKQSELNIAKRLGLTPEQYVREKMKMEARNG